MNEVNLSLYPSKKHRISIVTCSYEQGQFIESTLRSVLDQQYEDLEYIVIDGGSRDQTLGVLSRYEGRLAHLVSEPDQGQTDALIKGFSRATGDIHGWLCSDDLLLPGALDAVDAYFRDNPNVEAVYGNAIWIDQHGDYIRPKKEMGFNRFVFRNDHNYIPQPSMFWRAELYQRVGGLDPRFHLAMDADLWDRFARVTRIAHLDQYLSCMRFYPDQKTQKRRPEGEREDAEIRARDPGRLAAGRRVPARMLRILGKVAAGGYGARVPARYVTWLRQRRKGEVSR